jgi:hypothetical protein
VFLVVVVGLVLWIVSTQAVEKSRHHFDLKMLHHSEPEDVRSVAGSVVLWLYSTHRTMITSIFKGLLVVETTRCKGR